VMYVITAAGDDRSRVIGRQNDIWAVDMSAIIADGRFSRPAGPPPAL
jgi:hypothetical protein